MSAAAPTGMVAAAVKGTSNYKMHWLVLGALLAAAAAVPLGGALAAGGRRPAYTRAVLHIKMDVFFKRSFIYAPPCLF